MLFYVLWYALLAVCYVCCPMLCYVVLLMLMGHVMVLVGGLMNKLEQYCGVDIGADY